jgi:hypothetical protein
VREIFICRVECTMAVPGQLQTGNYFFCFPSSVEIFAATGRCLYPFLFLFYEQDAGLCGAVLGFLGHSICWRGGGRPVERYGLKICVHPVWTSRNEVRQPFVLPVGTLISRRLWLAELVDI